MKDVYISSIFVGSKCVYACSIIKDDSLIGYKVGHLSVQRPNKCCMYASDIISLENKSKEDNLRFIYKDDETYHYVKQMRPNQNIGIYKDSDKLYFDNNSNLMKDYIKDNFPHFANISIDLFDKWRY